MIQKRLGMGSVGLILAMGLGAEAWAGGPPRSRRDDETPKLSCIYYKAGADGFLAELFSDLRGVISTVELTPLKNGSKFGNPVLVKIADTRVSESRLMLTASGFQLRVDRFMTGQGIPYFTGELRWERLQRGLPYMMNCVLGPWTLLRR